MKMPLSIYIAYDKDYEHGPKIFKDLYSLLCRDPQDPLTDGLDIPVYLRTNVDGNVKEIENPDSERVLVLLLVDDSMYDHQEIWSPFVDDLFRKKSDNESFFVEGVKLSQYAFSLNGKLQKEQFITISKNIGRDTWNLEFKTRILDLLLRILIGNTNQKLKIFISHSKKDDENLGEEKAKELKAYIQNETKFDAFFDKNDILDGSNFKDKIDGGLKPDNCLLIILNTDTYSSREWCQHEVLDGKKFETPSVLVSLLKHKVDRLFPYLGNIPCLHITNEWGEVLFMLLRKAVDQNFERLLLNQLLEVTNNCDSFIASSSMPEVFDYRNDDFKLKNVLYPEPPLTKDEIGLLKEISEGDGKKFLTPMQLIGSDFKLDGINIAISISEVKNAADYGFNKNQIDDLSIEIVRHLLITDAHLVYGGDLRKGGYTFLFEKLALQYANYIKSQDTSKMFFTDYLAWPFCKIDLNEKLQFKECRTKLVLLPKPDIANNINDENIDFNDLYTRYCISESLSIMRSTMEATIDARILVGGEFVNFKGKIVGLYEEFLQSIKAQHPVYLLGGFGGAADNLVSLITGKKTVYELKAESLKNDKYAELLKYMAIHGVQINYKLLNSAYNNISILNNGLTNEENQILFKSQNIMEIVALILKGLKSKFS